MPNSSEMPLIAVLMIWIVVWGNPGHAVGEETPAQAFAAARAAAKADSEKLVSAIGTGEFSAFRQEKNEDEPKLSSKAKVHVYFDRGKYHVQVVYEKQVRQITTTKNGQKTISTEDGQGDEARIIVDDDAVYVVNFPKSKPRITEGQIFPREQEQFGFAMSGFPLNEPARLWKTLPDPGEVVTKAGTDEIAFSEIGKGRFRAAYPYFRQYTTEVEVDRSAGFHVTASRVVNSDRKDAAPVSNRKATWKQINDVWYVNEYVLESDSRETGGKSEGFSRWVFKYNSFDVNVKIEPHLFELNSFEIRMATPFTDRRKKGAEQVLYWNGMALQAERP